MTSATPWPSGLDFAGRTDREQMCMEMSSRVRRYALQRSDTGLLEAGVEWRQDGSLTVTCAMAYPYTRLAEDNGKNTQGAPSSSALLARRSMNGGTSGFWEPFDLFLRHHTDTQVSDEVCPECMSKLYPEQYERLQRRGRYGPRR
jgi:hypothetical protein